MSQNYLAKDKNISQSQARDIIDESCDFDDINENDNSAGK